MGTGTLEAGTPTHRLDWEKEHWYAFPMQSNPCSTARLVAEDLLLLEKALRFVQDDSLPELALALACYHDAHSMSYAQIADILDRDTPDVLLLAFSWRMLIPAPLGRSSLAWEEAHADFHPHTQWKMPPVIRHLVRTGKATGRWQPATCLPRVSSEFPQVLEAISHFMAYAGQYAPGGVISANLIRAATHESGIQAGLEQLIIDFKAAGVLSPKLASLPDTARHKSPLYELNPAIFFSSSTS